MATNIGKDTRQSLHELVESLRRDRQRLAVQINLGKREFHDDWERVEKKWAEVENHLSEVTDDSVKTAHHLGEEIAEMYRHLKNRLGISDKAD